MTATVVISTLMVLLSSSEHDMENLWTTMGAVNDPLGNKHEISLALAIRDGNFRSALIDDWENQTFTRIYVQGTNKFGDILWDTEFDVIGKTWTFSSWLDGENIINSTSLLSGTQETTFSEQNYRFRIGPSDSEDRSWFAVSNNGLSYGPLPQIFVPRSPDIPFQLPVFLDGNLGCWDKDTLMNVHLMFSDDNITPDSCIAACTGNTSIAIITVKLNCFCADKDPVNPPVNDLSKCYLICTSTVQICGGFTSNYGSPYHVKGQRMPGYTNTSSLFDKLYTPGSTSLEIDVSEIDVANVTSPAFISNISVSSTPTAEYSVQYSKRKCSETNGNMKSLSFDALTTTTFIGDGRIENVDILMLRCMVINIYTVLPLFLHVRLFGPEVTSEHILASALVIRGKSVIAIEGSTLNASTMTTQAEITSYHSPNTTSSSPITTSSIPPLNSTSSFTETQSVTPASSGKNSKSLCYCPCNVSASNLTNEELQERIDEIRRNLTMNVSKLSSTIRKLTSADDKRMSAASIGYIGVGILVVIFSAIVLIDSSLLHKDMKKLLDNIKNGVCYNKTDV